MDVATAMMPAPDTKQEEYAKQDMGGHAEMMCQLLIGLGRLEAKVDMLIAEDKQEDSKESEIESDNSMQGMLPALF